MRQQGEVGRRPGSDMQGGRASGGRSQVEGQLAGGGAAARKDRWVAGVFDDNWYGCETAEQPRQLAAFRWP
jgi:hypothetical protein